MTKQKRLETDLASRPDEDLFFVDKKGEDSIITNPVQSYFNQDFIPLDSKLPKNNTRYPKNNNKTQSKKFKNQSPTQQKKTAGNIKRQQERERQTLERKLLADEILRDYMEHMDQDSIIENSITLQNTDLLLSDSDLNSEDDSDSELDFEENQFEVLMEELDDIDYDSDELRIESNSDLDSDSGSDTNQYTYDSNNSQSNNKHSTMVMEMMKQSNHPHRNVDSESSSDDDSVDIAVSLGKSLKQTHIFDLDEEERFIKSEFEGKINTWELSPTTLAKMIEMTDSDEEFTNRLEGNYRFKPRKNSKFLDEEDSESDDSQPIDFGKSKRRKLEKLRRRRQKQELKRQQIENLNFSNELSKGLKSQRKGYNHDHIVTDLQRVLRKINSNIRQFVQNNDRPEYILLPPMPSSVRRIVCQIAKFYHVSPKIYGKGNHKSLIVYRTGLTKCPDNWSHIVDMVTSQHQYKEYANDRTKKKGSKKIDKKQGKVKSKGKGKAKSKGKDGRKPSKESATFTNEVINAAQPKMGDVVGAKAIPISENNFGHRMLLKMGWTPGQSLGASNDGIVQPIQAVIRSKRGGLGGE